MEESTEDTPNFTLIGARVGMWDTKTPRHFMQFWNTSALQGYIPCMISTKSSGLWAGQQFRPVSRYISKIVQDRDIVTMEH